MNQTDPPKEHRFNSITLPPKKIYCLQCGIALINPQSEKPCGWEPKRTVRAATLKAEAGMVSEPETTKRGRRGVFDAAPFPDWWNQHKLALAKAGARVTYATHVSSEKWTYRGITLSATAWSVVTNIPREVLVFRVSRLGWPLNQALKTRVAFRPHEPAAS